MMTDQSTISGREPALIATQTQKGVQLSRRALGSVLTALAPAQASPTMLAAALHHQDYLVRHQAANLLARRNDRETRLLLQDALQTGTAPTRAVVARVLAKLSWASAEPLLRQALRDDDARVVEGAVYALCDARHPVAYRLLSETLIDSHNDLCYAAVVFALRGRRDALALPALAATLNATDYEIRADAQETLASTEIPEAIPLVRRALADPHPTVQYNAVLSWLELAGDAALPELATTIQGATGAALAAMLRGFFHATNYLGLNLSQDNRRAVALQVIRAGLNDADPEARKAALWPLAWLRHPEANALLQETFAAETSGAVKAHLLYVAVNLLSPVADDLLARANNDADPTVQEMAQHIARSLARGQVVRLYANIEDRQSEDGHFHAHK